MASPPVFLPGDFQGQKSLAGYSPWGRKESDTTERLSTLGSVRPDLEFFAAKDGEARYSQQKQDLELTVAQIMNSLLPNSDIN